MSTPFKKLSEEFEQLISLNKEIVSLQNDIKNKLNKLRFEYSNFRKQNKDSLHVFCLDSIHFQLRLYNSYYESYVNIFKTINNHLYRDYYKVWKRLKHYVETSINDKNIKLIFENYHFPIYCDLNVDKTYDLDIINDLHDRILNVLSSISKYSNNCGENIPKQQVLVNQGYDLKNLSASFVFNNNVIESHIKLYIDLLSFFKQQKTKYLEEHYKKMKILYNELPPIDNFMGGTNNYFSDDFRDDNNDDNNSYNYSNEQHTNKEVDLNKTVFFNESDDNINNYYKKLKIHSPHYSKYDSAYESENESETKSVSSIIEKFNNNSIESPTKSKRISFSNKEEEIEKKESITETNEIINSLTITIPSDEQNEEPKEEQSQDQVDEGKMKDESTETESANNSETNTPSEETIVPENVNEPPQNINDPKKKRGRKPKKT